MKRITVEARAYKNKDGMVLMITSSRTENTIFLLEKWFDNICELMWLRVLKEMEIQDNFVLPVPIAFTIEDLKHFWSLYRQQQKDRKKRLLPQRN